MQSLRRTYRILKAGLLLTFAMGILAPTAVSAAGLFCDMIESSVATTAMSCCADHTMQKGETHATSHADRLDVADCEMDAYCASYVDMDADEAPAVQQSTGKVPAAVISGEVRSVPDSKPARAYLRASDPSHVHSPPLFLLNASFLN